MKVSIAIPCYEMSGRGEECLEYSFNKLLPQTFTDFEVVISDHSIDDKIFLLCDLWRKKLNIKYVRNEKNRGSLAGNLNSCMDNCSGELIKFLMQDDFLLDENSLRKIVDKFDYDKQWNVSQYYHTKNRKDLYKLHTPIISYNPLFVNLIGCPSCLTIKNKGSLKWDEGLNWFVDSDLYLRMLKTYGKPSFLLYPVVAQLIWSGQTTKKFITSEIVSNETNYLIQKYGGTV